ISNIRSESGSPSASAFSTALSIERSKYLRLPRPVKGSVRLSAFIASRLCCRLLISLFDSSSRSSSALLVSRISRVGLHQRFDDGSDLALILGDGKLLLGARQARVVARRHTQCVGNKGYHVVDLANDAGADLVDALGGLDLGKIGFVDRLEIGLGQLAVAVQRFVDDLVERRI